MGNIGSSELLVILVLALLLLGPSRLPDVGDALGKTLRRFRHASRELRDELDLDRDPRPARSSERLEPPAVASPASPAATAAAATDAPPPPAPPGPPPAPG